MKIAVCIKQVPLNTKIEVNPSTQTLVREGTETQLNPYDEYAIEEAIRIKEQTGGHVSVYSMGPPQAEEILRDAIALGADSAYLLTDKAFAGADTLATSYTLAKAMKHIGFPDLIICGKQAIDGDTAQVGPSISKILNTSLSSNVQKVKTISEKDITVEQMMDNSYHIVNLKLPALITVVKGINTPRAALLGNRLKALSAKVNILNAEILKIDSSQCGLEGSPTRVYKSFVPKRAKTCKILKGENQKITKDLLSILKPFIVEKAK